MECPRADFEIHGSNDGCYPDAHIAMRQHGDENENGNEEPNGDDAYDYTVHGNDAVLNTVKQ